MFLKLNSATVLAVMALLGAFARAASGDEARDEAREVWRVANHCGSFTEPRVVFREPPAMRNADVFGYIGLTDPWFFVLRDGGAYATACEIDGNGWEFSHVEPPRVRVPRVTAVPAARVGRFVAVVGWIRNAQLGAVPQGGKSRCSHIGVADASGLPYQVVVGGTTILRGSIRGWLHACTFEEARARAVGVALQRLQAESADATGRDHFEDMRLLVEGAWPSRTILKLIDAVGFEGGDSWRTTLEIARQRSRLLEQDWDQLGSLNWVEVISRASRGLDADCIETWEEIESALAETPVSRETAAFRWRLHVLAAERYPTAHVRLLMAQLARPEYLLALEAAQVLSGLAHGPSEAIEAMRSGASFDADCELELLARDLSSSDRAFVLRRLEAIASGHGRPAPGVWYGRGHPRVEALRLLRQSGVPPDASMEIDMFVGLYLLRWSNMSEAERRSVDQQAERVLTGTDASIETLPALEYVWQRIRERESLPEWVLRSRAKIMENARALAADKRLQGRARDRASTLAGLLSRELAE